MHCLSPEKRIPAAVGASAFLHAAMVGVLLWKGSVFSPAGLISGPVDFIESAVKVASAPAKPVKPVAPKKEVARVIPKDDAGVVTSKAAPAEVAPSAPTESAPLAVSNASAGGRDPSEMSRYVGLLVAAVQKNRRYPKDAIDREEEGVVGLTVKLGSNGDLIEATVKHPSPFASLNDAALKTVKTIAHFPKPPIADGTIIELVIPMRFKIERL